MIPYIPKVKVFFDWDGDGYINRGVPVGAPVNRIPDAPFPRAFDLRHYDTGAFTTVPLLDDTDGLVGRSVELLANERVTFGYDFKDWFRPVANPNRINSLKSTTLTISTREFDEDGKLIWYGNFPNNNYIGGSASTAEIPVTNGVAYTFLFYAEVTDASLSSIDPEVRNAAGTVRASTNFSAVGDGWYYLQYTAVATENINFFFSGVAPKNRRIKSYTNFMFLQGTYTTPPEGYTVWNVAPFTEPAYVWFYEGIDYVSGVSLITEDSCDLDVTLYRQNSGEASPSVLLTTTLSMTAGVRKKLQFSIPSSANTSFVYGVIETDTDTTLTAKGYYIYEGTVQRSFSAGELAAYDDVSSYALAAKWNLGRRKVEELIGYEGIAEVTLNNDSRLFSPSNAESPLSFKRNVLAVIEVENPADFTLKRVFTGWTELFDVVVGTKSNRQARITIRQGMFRLREGAFSPIVEEAQRIDELLPNLLDMAGWRYAHHPVQTVLDYDSRLGYTTLLATDQNVYEREELGLNTYDLVGQDWNEETNIQKALEDLLDAEAASFWLGREGTLNFVNRTFFLHRPEFMDYHLVLDTNTQEGTYEYGRDSASTVTITAKPKDLERGAVIWETRPAILVEPSETVRTQMKFQLENDFSVTVTAVDDKPTFTAYYQVRNRSNTPIPISAADLEKVSVSVENDALGRYWLVIQSNLARRIWVEASVTGDYVKGGSGIIYDFHSEDALRAINEVRSRRLTSSIITTEAEAEGLADTIFLRDGTPQGEFTSFTIHSRSQEAVSGMLEIKTGDRAYISEHQTGEDTVPHIVLGEDGSFDGRLLKIKYNIGRMDKTIYGYVGDEIVSPYVDVIEGESFLVGDGKVTDIVRFEMDGLAKLVEFEAGAKAFYTRGNKPKINVDPFIMLQLGLGNTKAGITRGQNSGFFYSPSTGQGLIKVVPDRSYRFKFYTQDNTGVVVNPPADGVYVIGDLEGVPNAAGNLVYTEDSDPAFFVPDAGVNGWHHVEGYFKAWRNSPQVATASIGFYQHSFLNGRDLSLYEKYPVVYLEPSTDYTLYCAVRPLSTYAEAQLTIQVVAVEPPPYASGDGDVVIATHAFTPDPDEIQQHFYSFTSPASSNPIRLVLKYTNEDTVLRELELFEFGLLEGTITSLPLGSLTNDNPNVVRLAV